MKNIFLKASLFCLMLLTFSCSKDSEYLDLEGVYTMKVKIDGVSTQFENVTTLITTVGNRKNALITCVSENYKLVFTLSNFTNEGEYDLAISNSAAFTDNQTPTSMFLSHEGTLEITKVVDRGKKLGTAIDGTFDLKVEDQNGTERILTEGSLSSKVITP